MLVTERSFLTTAGVDLCYFEWQNSPISVNHRAPVILFIHATGFHARCWDEIVRLLLQHELLDSRVITVDVRGHGRSALNGTRCDWVEGANDIMELIRHHNWQRLLICGHSMGGHIACSIALKEKQRVAGLLLIDPTLLVPEFYNDEHSDRYSFVQKRRKIWSSPYEMLSNFQSRKPFQIFSEQSLLSYVCYGLKQLPDNNYELLCQPADEQQFYEAGVLTSHSLYSQLSNIQCPVTLIRAKGLEQLLKEGLSPDPANMFSYSPTALIVPELLMKSVRCFRDVYLPQATHFIPMQEPQLVVRELLRMMSALFGSKM